MKTRFDLKEKSDVRTWGTPTFKGQLEFKGPERKIEGKTFRQKKNKTEE